MFATLPSAEQTPNKCQLLTIIIIFKFQLNDYPSSVSTSPKTMK